MVGEVDAVRMIRMRAVLGAAIVAGLAGAELDAAAAQTRHPACARLEAELASINQARPRRNEQLYQRYDRSFHKQLGLIDRTKRQLRRNGCEGGLFGVRSRSGDFCANLALKIRQMEATLDKIAAKRSRHAGDTGNNGNSGRERRQVIRDLARFRCDQDVTRRADRRRPRSDGFFSSVFRRRPLFDRDAPNQRSNRPPYLAGRERFFEPNYDVGFRSEFATYRTLCVRICDG